LKWCFACDIFNVTIFDGLGFYKEHKMEIKNILQEKLISFLPDEQFDLCFLESPMAQLIRKTSQDLLVTRNTSNSGHPNSPLIKSFHVQVTSLEDGKERIVLCAKKLAQIAKQNVIKTDEIAGFEIMNRALGVQEGQEPDFVMLFGFNQKGFLPWETRYSEIMQMGEAKYITFHKFWKAILFYNDCKKRFGK